MNLAGEDGDYRVMMKAATAVMILAIACVVLLLIAGWIAIVILGAAFVWIGITTMIEGNVAMGTAEFIIGILGLTVAALIAVFYEDSYM